MSGVTPPLSEEEQNDAIYDQDITHIQALLHDLAEALIAAGLAGPGGDEITVKVRCCSRLGVPIEVEG